MRVPLPTSSLTGKQQQLHRTALFLFLWITCRLEVYPSSRVDGAALGNAGEDFGEVVSGRVEVIWVVLEPRETVHVLLRRENQVERKNVKPR